VEQRLLQQLGAVAEEFSLFPAVSGRGRQFADMGHQGIGPAGDSLQKGNLLIVIFPLIIKVSPPLVKQRIFRALSPQFSRAANVNFQNSG
jgi:hypothetical protein